MERVYEEEDEGDGDDDEGFSSNFHLSCWRYTKSSSMCYFEKWRKSMKKKMEVVVVMMKDFESDFIDHVGDIPSRAPNGNYKQHLTPINVALNEKVEKIK
ncbi:unnamed protein product [Dovyalis caffra]|uniref:Uncharacterized protein n=1 Tax=Dovyalis caffra TaxID=77055 RepID=A0AAV1R9A2_9ROSI|nr:unnamed protein product [Dovyalis caffra]